MLDQHRELIQKGIRVKIYPNAVHTYDPETGWEWMAYDEGLSSGRHHREPIDFVEEGMDWNPDPYAWPRKYTRIVRLGWLYYKIVWQRIVSEKRDLLKSERSDKRELVSVRVALTSWGPWRSPTPLQMDAARQAWQNIIHDQIEEECT
jgi:hypothetical protein